VGLWKAVIKVYGKLIGFLVHAIKKYGGNSGTAPLILNDSVRWRECLTSFFGRFIPLNRRLDVSQRRSGYFGEEKNILPIKGDKLRTVRPLA
jgi:hypothetical protein